ncbi:MAG: preprotein translocase subunit SecG [Bdellovibrionales bacterium]
METLITVVHILVALVLIGLVLIQDSKGGALGMGGSTGSNSVLGAGGAQTLAAKATRWVAVVFALTSIGLSVMTAHKTRSVVEGAGPLVAPAAAPEAQTPPADATSSGGTTAPQAPASSETPKK